MGRRTCSACEMTPISDIEKLERLRSQLGHIAIEGGDNLAIALCTYFADRHDRPSDDEETERGWGEWVEKECDEVLTKIAALFIADWKQMRGEIERLTKERDEAYERAARVCETSRTVPGILIGTTFKEPIYKDGDRCAKAIRNLKAKDEQ